MEGALLMREDYPLRSKTTSLIAVSMFLFFMVFTTTVRGEDQPRPLPEISQGVEEDTRKALEQMEEALMDQIQREDMQAAALAETEPDATVDAEPEVTPAAVSEPSAPPQPKEPSTENAAAVPASPIPESTGSGRKIPAPIPAPEAVPEQKQQSKMPVYIRDSGVDQAGLRLGFFARETFSASSQFALSNRNERKIVIRIDSKPEFPTRPALSSVYAATWILVEDEATVPYYLDTLIGVVSPDSARMEADRIVSRTARILEQFAYLFE